MTNRLLSLFLILSLFLFISSCAQKADNKIKKEITNNKTSKHINIPGTRLYMIPPPGFTVAKTFIGLENGNLGMMNVYDLVGGNYNTNAATFSKEAFESKGLKVYDFQTITVNGFPCKYVSIQADATTTAHSLVFGDTTFSVMIMSSYVSANEEIGKQILGAINSIYYDKSKAIDPYETANFTLDESKSKFKFQNYTANLYIYTIDGKDNKGQADDPGILITQFPMDGTPKQVAEAMVDKAGQYGLTEFKIRDAGELDINGQKGYAMEIHGLMKGKPSILYTCVVAKGDKGIIIQGIAPKDPEENLKEFKNLINTIQIK